MNFGVTGKGLYCPTSVETMKRRGKYQEEKGAATMRSMTIRFIELPKSS